MFVVSERALLSLLALIEVVHDVLLHIREQILASVHLDDAAVVSLVLQIHLGLASLEEHGVQYVDLATHDLLPRDQLFYQLWKLELVVGIEDSL